jgi:hypothetical protein
VLESGWKYRIRAKFLSVVKFLRKLGFLESIIV